MKIKIPYILLFTLPLVFLGTIIANKLMIKDHIVFPNPEYRVSAYTDKIFGGKSQLLHEVVGSDFCHIDYILKKTKPYTFARIGFSQASTVDIQQYDSVRLEIAAINANKLRFQINYYDPEHFNAINHNTAITTSYILLLDDKNHTHHISLNDMKIPEWFYTIHNLNRYEVDIKKKFKYVRDFEILSPLNSQFNIKYTIKIKRLILYKSGTALLTEISVLILLYSIYICSILCYTFFIRRRKKILEPEVVAVEKIEGQKIDDITGTVLTYIGTNFQNRELNINTISRECDIPEYKVSQIIKNRFNLSFPIYLNMIRLSEAKRLLNETNLKINEISHNVGYNSYEHFNRIFKKHEHQSPTQYRNSVQNQK